MDNYFFRNKNFDLVGSHFSLRALFGRTWASQTWHCVKCAYFQNMHIVCIFWRSVHIFGEMCIFICVSISVAPKSSHTSANMQANLDFIKSYSIWQRPALLLLARLRHSGSGTGFPQLSAAKNMHKICTQYAQNIEVFVQLCGSGCWSRLQSKWITIFFETKVVSVLVRIFLYAHHLGARGPRRCDFSRNVHIFRMCIYCAYFDEMCIFLAAA